MAGKKNKLIRKSNFPPLTKNFLFEYSFNDPKEYENYLRITETLETMSPNKQIMKRVNKYFNLGSVIIPHFLIRQFTIRKDGSSEKEADNHAKLKLVYHLTKEFGGPYSSLSMIVKDIPKESNYFDDHSYHFAPLGMSLAEIELGYLILKGKSKADSKKFKEFQSKSDKFFQKYFFSILKDSPGKKEAIRSITKSIQITPLYDSTFINLVRGGPQILRNDLRYIKRYIGERNFELFMDKTAKTYKTGTISESVFQQNLNSYDKIEDIKAEFKKLPNEIKNYTRSNLVKKVTSMYSYDFQFWCVYYFTSKFRNPVKNICFTAYEEDKKIYYIYPFEDKINIDFKNLKNILLEKYDSEEVDFFINWMSKSVYNDVHEISKIFPKLVSKKENWLVFGVSDIDYSDWRESSKVNLTTFSKDDYESEEDTIKILGDFNNILDLHNLSNSEYDKIIFSEATAKFLVWFGVHLSIISQKLKPNGVLYIPEEITVVSGEVEKFKDLTLKINSFRDRMLYLKKPNILILHGMPSARRRRTDTPNPYESTSYQSVFIGENRINLDTQVKSKMDLKELKKKYDEYYYENNTKIFNYFFNIVEYLDGLKYVGPNKHSGENFWKLSNPKTMNLSEEDIKIISHNVNLKSN